MKLLPRAQALIKGQTWILWGVLIGLAFTWLQFAHELPALFRPVEYSLNDSMRRSVADPTSENRIVIIDIDENSLSAIGPWPWSRELLAQMLEDLIAEHQARMVGLDIVFPSAADPAGDDRLQALAQLAPIVLAQLFDLTEREKPILSGVPIRTTSAWAGAWPHASGYLANHAGLSQARCAGHINSVIDDDGAVRRLTPIVYWDQAQYLTLSLAMLACDPQTAKALPSIVAGIPGPEWVVPYTKKLEAYTVIPASQILNKQVDSDMLRGKWVLIGSSALGLNDTVTIPLASSVSGVMVHAQALTTWLDRLTSNTPPPTPWVTARAVAVVWTVLSLLLLMWVMVHWRAWTLVPLGAGLALAWWGLASEMITWQQPFVVSAPLLANMAVLLVVPLLWWRTQKDGKQLFNTFATYVAPSVLEKMVAQGLDKPLTPHHAHISVLSADMQNYSGLTASGSLQQTADLTKGFLACITGPLLRHQGTLDKYTGDGLVAFWGAPLSTPEPANLAMQAALEMVESVRAWNQQRSAQGLPMARLRIGIESGQALVGDLGTSFRSTYTAVGNCINNASKIQAAAKHYSHDILVGEAAAADITVVPLVKVADLRWGETVNANAVYAPLHGPQSCPPGSNPMAQP